MSKRRRGYPSEQRVKRGTRIVHGDKELIREAWSQRSVPVRVREAVSRSAVCRAASSMAPIGTTTNAKSDAPAISGRALGFLHPAVDEPAIDSPQLT